MPGNFYLYSIKQSSSLPSWLQFGSARSAARSLERKFGGLRASVEAGAGGSGHASPRTYMYPGGGCMVAPGMVDVSAGGQLYRVQPAVYSTKNALAVFFGFISNLDELQERFASEHGFKPSLYDDPSSLLGGSQHDQGTLAAELLLRMHLQADDSSGAMLMLSELQGQYAFVIYDGDKRQVFAARDPSGREALYYALDEDGALSLTNDPASAPGDEADDAWHEVPPGHYLAGRTPRLQQFALTPEQLSLREYLESIDDDLPADADASPTYAAGRSVPLNLHELVKVTSNHSSASEGDLFAFET